jgi:hypothetical protein
MLALLAHPLLGHLHRPALLRLGVHGRGLQLQLNEAVEVIKREVFTSNKAWLDAVTQNNCMYFIMMLDFR